MEIKVATAHDLHVIQKLAETIWPISYAGIITNEQISYMLKLIYNPEALKIQHEKGHQFVIAFKNDIPIGFASFSQKSEKEFATFRLHKLYVLTTHHAKGIGSFLLDYVCTQSKNTGGDLLELNVNKSNPATIFYAKKGFKVFKEEILEIENGYVMDDYVMVKAL